MAIQRLLAGTGLTYRFNGARAVTIDLPGQSEFVSVTATAATLATSKFTTAARDIPQTTAGSTPRRAADPWHLVLYPSTSLHRVQPVTRGARVASFFWIQSMVRDDAKRTLLFDLDVSIQRLNQDVPDHPAVVQLTSVYHNLLRHWAEM